MEELWRILPWVPWYISRNCRSDRSACRFPVSGKTCGSPAPALEVLAGLEMKWFVRAELCTAPEVCVRAACAVQLLWQLRLLLQGMWCFPGMHITQAGSSRAPFAFSPQCGCAAKELAVVQMREVRSRRKQGDELPLSPAISIYIPLSPCSTCQAQPAELCSW